MAKAVIGQHVISVGEALPWPLYDLEGRLLLEAGEIIRSRRQMDALVRRGIRGDPPKTETPSVVVTPRPKGQEIEDDASPFERLDGVVRRLRGVFRFVIEGREEGGERLLSVVKDLRDLFKFNPDAMIGAVHLSHEYDYTLCHPIHCAILCEMMGHVLSYEDSRINSLVGAALTQNLGMLKLQETLQDQAAPLSDAQRQEIRVHPALGVQILRKAKVEDPRWLAAVAQHHERFDGKGYPKGVAGNKLLQESQILGLSDRYSAMISGRSYRDGRQAKAALRDIFLGQSKEFVAEITQRFIREIGVYPPGSFVKLANGEGGIVIKRGRGPLEPIVSAYLGPRGQRYVRPFRRVTSNAEYKVEGSFWPDNSAPINLTQIFAA